MACATSLALSALTAALPALADGPAPKAAAAPPGQKPPCVPMASYVLAYDCELFPLPALAAAPAAAAPAVVAPVAGPPPEAGAAAVVAPAAVAPGVTPPAVPAPATPDVTPPPTPPIPVVPAAPAAPDLSASTSGPSSSSGSPSHAPAYVAFAVGAAGVGMTVAFGILALKANSTLSTDCAGGKCPASDSSTLSNMKLYDNMADIGLGVAVAGVATGVILFVTEKGSSTPSSGSGSTRHVEPWIGLGSGGLRGSF